MKTTHLITLVATSAFSLSGCSTSQHVSSEAITNALDLEKTDRFALHVVDTNDIDTAFSDQAQEFTADLLIDDLEDDGLDYVGERDPQIRFQFRTYAATTPTYVDPSPVGEIEVTTVETRETLNGTVTETRTFTSTDAREQDDRIYLGPDSRLFMLEAFDEETEALLWRGYTTVEDTGITEEVLAEAVEILTDRLEEET